MNLFLKSNVVLMLCLGILSCVGSTGLMTHEHLERALLQDGVYEGRHVKLPLSWANSVVTIKQGKIAEIEIKRCLIFPLKRKSKKKLKNIPEEIIQKQSIMVDAVSSATSSSYSLMHAVQNAVNKALVSETIH